MSDTSKGYVFVVAAAFLTGLIYTTGKVALEQLSPEFFVTWIFLIASVILAVWTTLLRRWNDILRCNRREWMHILAFSLFSIAALQTMWAGVQHLDPTVASFIGRLQTFVSVFLGVVFLKERFGVREAIGAVVLLIGTVIIRISFDVTLSLWFWVMVSSAVFFGVTEVFAKRAVYGLHPVPLNFIRNSLIAGVSAVILAARGEAFFDFQERAGYVAAVALMGPIGSRLCFLFALRHIDVSKAVLVNQLQPIFVAIVAFTTLGMVPALREWVGGFLILAGCLALIRGRNQDAGRKI